MVGDRSPDSRDPSIRGHKDSVMDGVAGLLILSLANVFIPCGYGVNSRGWRLLIGCWIGKQSSRSIRRRGKLALAQN